MWFYIDCFGGRLGARFSESCNKGRGKRLMESDRGLMNPVIDL